MEAIKEEVKKKEILIAEKIKANLKDIPAEYVNIVNENFWDLLEKEKRDDNN